MPDPDGGTPQHEQSLGPLTYRVPCGMGTRLGAAFIAAACVALLVLGARLSPDPSGVGTHTQLGVAACPAPRDWGIPCPTCGVTTAFVHAAQGHVLTALTVQPVGGLAAVGIVLLALACGATLVTGRKWVVNWSRVPALRLAVAVVAVVLLAWMYKIATY